jgi:hypothetical protein
MPPKTQPLEQHIDKDKGKRDKLNALIGEQVMHTLGEPGNLLKVQVRPLWENFYRVNFFIGSDTAFAKISNSYFVQAESDGNIVASTPKIMKQY